MASRRSQESRLRTLDDSELGSMLQTTEWGSALAVLWDRHAGLLYSTARSLCRSEDDARDAMSDALAKIAQRSAAGSIAIDSSFKSFAVMVVRNACHDAWRRTGRVDVTDDVDLDVGRSSFLPDPVLDDLDEKYVASAFGQLPERYRQVLWLTEVEGLPPREVADLLGMTPNNVSQIAVRARASLREGWAAAHLTQLDASNPCRDFVNLLPGLAARTLADARSAPVHDHLAQCLDCSALHRNLMSDTMKLRGLALPIPAVLMFRHLRKVAGGAAQSAGQSAGVFSQTVEVVRQFATAAQAVFASTQTAVLIGAGAVVAAATVTAGAFAITSLTGDDRSASTPAADIGEPAPPDDPGQDPTDTTPTETISPDTTQPTDTTAPPETTQPPDTTPPTTSPTLPPFDLSSRGPTPQPTGTLTNNTIITLGTPLRRGSSRSWIYEGTAGTKIAFGNTGGGFMYLSGNLPSTLSLCTLCDITENGSYIVTLSADEETLPGSTQVVISANTEVITANNPIDFDTPLPEGLVKLFRYQAQAGDVFAIGFVTGSKCEIIDDYLSSCQTLYGSTLFEDDGEIVCRYEFCVADRTAAYTLCIGFATACKSSTYDELPATETLGATSADSFDLTTRKMSDDPVTACGLGTEISIQCDDSSNEVTWAGVFTPTQELDLNVPLSVEREFRPGEPFMGLYDGTAGEFVALGSRTPDFYPTGGLIIDIPEGSSMPTLGSWRYEGAILPRDGWYGLLFRPNTYGGSTTVEVEIGGPQGALVVDSVETLPPSSGPVSVWTYSTTVEEIARTADTNLPWSDYASHSVWQESIAGEATRINDSSFGFFGRGPLTFLAAASDFYIVATTPRTSNNGLPVDHNFAMWSIAEPLGRFAPELTIDSAATISWTPLEWSTRIFSFEAQEGQVLAFSGAQPGVSLGEFFYSRPAGPDDPDLIPGPVWTFRCVPTVLGYCGGSSGIPVRIPQDGQYFFVPYAYNSFSLLDPFPSQQALLYTVPTVTLDTEFTVPDTDFTVAIDGDGYWVQFEGRAGQMLTDFTIDGLNGFATLYHDPLFCNIPNNSGTWVGQPGEECVLPVDGTYFVKVYGPVPAGTRLLIRTDVGPESSVATADSSAPEAKEPDEEPDPIEEPATTDPPPDPGVPDSSTPAPSE